jgi:chaperonin cofactor prefoldin
MGAARSARKIRKTAKLTAKGGKVKSRLTVTQARLEKATSKLKKLRQELQTAIRQHEQLVASMAEGKGRRLPARLYTRFKAARVGTKVSDLMKWERALAQKINKLKKREQTLTKEIEKLRGRLENLKQSK